MTELVSYYTFIRIVLAEVPYDGLEGSNDEIELREGVHTHSAAADQLTDGGSHVLAAPRCRGWRRGHDVEALSIHAEALWPTQLRQPRVPLPTKSGRVTLSSAYSVNEDSLTPVTASLIMSSFFSKSIC